jgi:4-amino-4-deoxy-L-arabinose transferase-like glycosyltransferase
MSSRRRVPTVPRPLALLLVAAALLAACWALIVPAFQTPDEQSHFGYAQTFAERGQLPGTEASRRFSTVQDQAADAVGSDQLAGNLDARAEWSRVEHERWRLAESRYARDDGAGLGPEGANPARTNPPLYYAYESMAYHVAPAAIFDQLYLMRLWSALLLLVAVAATWALVGEALGRRRSLQLAGAALVALQPMASFISASINPDSLLIAAFAVALWLGVRVVRRGLTLANGAALCAAAAVAILTKATGYALVPAVVLALVLGARQAGVRMRIGALVRAAAPLLALALPVVAWLVYARVSDRPAINQVAGAGDGAGVDHPGLFSYLWQFYLPHAPGQQPLPGNFTPLPLRDIWLEGGWGKFGWLEIELPQAIYLTLGALTLALAIGAVLAIVRSGASRHVGPLAFLALAVLTLVGGLHITEYRIMSNEGGVFNQGRYLLPLLPILGLAGAATLSLFEERARSLATGALLGGLFVLQIVSLAIVGARFHV